MTGANLEAQYSQAFSGLPPARRALLEQRLGDAIIFVEYTEHSTAREKSSTIPDVLATLSDSPQGYIGNVTLPDRIAKWVTRLTIRRGSFNGPLFDVVSAGSFANPVVSKVRSKLEKHYDTDCPTELLAYHVVQPMLPSDTWLPAVQATVTEVLPRSVFRQVWLFDVPTATVVYSYPAVA